MEFLLTSETWLTENTENKFVEIEGYDFVRLDRDNTTCKSRGGGVGLYYKLRFNIIKRDELCFSLPSIEALVCKLKLKNTRDIYIICIYRPPEGDIKEFVRVLTDILLELRTKPNVELLIGGDFNINSKRKTDPKTKLYNDFLKDQLFN